MADQLVPPKLILPIPPQIVNEGAVFGPLNLNEYIQSPDPDSGKIYFFAEITDGSALPKGIICTGDGTITGIAAAGTHGNYNIRVVAENDAGVPCTAEFTFTIKERMTVETQAEVGSCRTSKF